MAKRLLTETRLPITQIAFAAGFSSVRRFNAAFRATYARHPTHIRQTAGTDGTSAETGITLRLAYRPPLNWRLLMQFLSVEATPGVEDVSGNRYRRTVQVAGGAGWLEAQPVPGKDAIRMQLTLPTYTNLRTVIQRVRQLFDLDADPSRITRQLGTNSRLKSLLQATAGIRLPGTWDGFELAIRAILSESNKQYEHEFLAALVSAYGPLLVAPPPGGPERLFPSPSALSQLGTGATQCVVSPHAIQRIRQLSDAVLAGAIRFDATSTFAKLVEDLVTYAGLPESRAAWVAMRTLLEPDARLGDTAAFVGAKMSDVLSPSLRPWRSYVALAQRSVAEMTTAALGAEL
jgi:AraC family transcriptional regulator of adaptative response / DNA-3-methyladenine glycosylase II